MGRRLVASIALTPSKQTLFYSGYDTDDIAELAAPATQIVTSGDYTATGTKRRIIVNKTVGAATAITMDDATSMANLEILIKDGKGDASSNNITITDASGGTFDGQSSLVISSDFGFYWIKAVGDNWLTI